MQIGLTIASFAVLWASDSVGPVSIGDRFSDCVAPRRVDGRLFAVCIDQNQGGICYFLNILKESAKSWWEGIIIFVVKDFGTIDGDTAQRVLHNLVPSPPFRLNHPHDCLAEFSL